MKTAIAIGVLLFASTILSASAQEITIKSIAYTSLPYYSTTVYPINSASSDTFCNSTGIGNTNATVYPAPGGATVSGTTTTNTDTNCTTTYHPAQNGQFTQRVIYNYNLVEANGYRYELLCTASWYYSKCAYLIPGQSFQATIKGSDMLIQGTNAKGKAKEVKYHILAMGPYPVAASKPENPNPSSKPESDRVPVNASAQQTRDIHVRPLVMSSIRLPKAVTSAAVGAPQLFEVKRSDQDPQTVLIKANTPEVRTTNLIVTLQSGEEMNMRLISDVGADKHTSFEAPSNVVSPSSQVTIQAASTASTVTMVSLNSSPSGAEIEVDGVFLGSTPADLPLTVGQRKIKISKRGFKTYERVIQVLSSSAQRISVELESQ